MIQGRGGWRSAPGRGNSGRADQGAPVALKPAGGSQSGRGGRGASRIASATTVALQPAGGNQSGRAGRGSTRIASATTVALKPTGRGQSGRGGRGAPGIASATTSVLQPTGRGQSGRGGRGAPAIASLATQLSGDGQSTSSGCGNGWANTNSSASSLVANLSYRELQQRCKAKKLKATGTAEELKQRLLGANTRSTTTLPEGNEEAAIANPTNSTIEKPPIKWQNSDAKKHILEKLCASKDDPYWNMKPKEIIASNKKMFEPYKKNLSSNLNRLKKTIRRNMEMISFDDKAVLEHLANFPPSTINNRGNISMQGHRGKELLELDVAAGKTKGVKPLEFKKTRKEYEDFGNKQFSKAVHREVAKQREETFWIDKRNREGARRHVERRNKRLQEANMLK